MRVSRWVFGVFLVLFTGVLVWLAAEPRYLPDEGSRAIWLNRRENRSAWEQEKKRLREQRLITNNIITGLFALDGLGFLALGHSLWRDRRGKDDASHTPSLQPLG